MASIDVAKLLNKITRDIPGINTVLKALANWDVSALSDVPDGAMQATTDTNNRLTIKKKVSGSYAPVAKLMHDVDQLDGCHASAAATPDTIAVRNAQGALPGNILGNAATADTATALATGSVVPVNQGGTGATTASQARANLGVAGSSDFTEHIAKQASSSVEGHVKLDALAANGSNTAAPGGYGLGQVVARRVDNLDLIMETCFFSYNAGATGLPVGVALGGFGFTISYNSTDKVQVIYTFDTPPRPMVRKRNSSLGWQGWSVLPNGITDSTATTSSTVAASATAVKAVSAVASAAQTTANSAAAAASTPATTTSRGIARVATLADMEPGAVVGNGPAVIDAKGGVITPTPTAHAVPQADAGGHIPIGFIPGLVVGDIRLLPYRASDLATYCPGWHHCNGDGYDVTSAVGIALAALPATLKSDWGITVSGSTIYVPNLYYTDGRGYYLRAVDGSSRQVGSVALDKFQGHRHGAYSGNNDAFPGPPYFKLANTANGWGPSYTTVYGVDGSSGTPRTGSETSVLDIGMTPAIFLNV